MRCSGEVSDRLCSNADLVTSGRLALAPAAGLSETNSRAHAEHCCGVGYLEGPGSPRDWGARATLLKKSLHVTLPRGGTFCLS